MKTKLFILIGTALMAFAGCSEDNSEIYERLDNIETRLDELELRCSELNASMASIRTLAEAIDKNWSITAVTESKDDSGNVIGYTVKLSNNESFYIPFGKDGKDGEDGSDGRNGQDGTNGKDGVDGKDGVSPEISVALDENGVLCWKLNGEWLLDPSGNRIKVTGDDGQTPKFEIRDNYWYVIYPDGKTSQVGPAVASGSGSGSPFTSVVDNGETVTFTLSGDVSFTLPKEKVFSITLSKSKDVPVIAGSTVEIGYTITSATSNTIVETLSEGGYKATVTPSSISEGVITVVAPDPLTDGKLLVFAADGCGSADMKAITFEAGVISLADDAQNIGEDGGEVTFTVSSNMEYEVVIPEDVDWITLASTRAVVKSVVSLTVSKNLGPQRSATISVVPQLGNPLTFVVSQDRNSESLLPESLEIQSDIQGSQAVLKDALFILSVEENANYTGFEWNLPEGLVAQNGTDGRSITLSCGTAPVTFGRGDISVTITTRNGESGTYSFSKYLHILDGVTAKRFGQKAWTLTNLNNAGTDGNLGVCHQDDADGSKYGRYYTWAEAMTGISGATESFSYGDSGIDAEGNAYILNDGADSYNVQIQGACPEGWHVPNAYDFYDLAAGVAEDYGLRKETLAEVIESKSGIFITDNRETAPMTAMNLITNGFVSSYLRGSRPAAEGGMWAAHASNVENGTMFNLSKASGDFPAGYYPMYFPDENAAIGFNILPCGQFNNGSLGSFGSYSFHWTATVTSADKCYRFTIGNNSCNLSTYAQLKTFSCNRRCVANY